MSFDLYRMGRNSVKRSRQRVSRTGTPQARPKIKQPYHMSSKALIKKYFIVCPAGCTQSRTASYNLKEEKTFDTRTQECRNCPFTKKTQTEKSKIVFRTGSGKIAKIIDK